MQKNWVHVATELKQPELGEDFVHLNNGALIFWSLQTSAPHSFTPPLGALVCGNPGEHNQRKTATMTLSRWLSSLRPFSLQLSLHRLN